MRINIPPVSAVWFLSCAAGRGAERTGHPGPQEGQREADLGSGEAGEPAGGHEGPLPGVEGTGRGQSCEYRTEE